MDLKFPILLYILNSYCTAYQHPEAKSSVCRRDPRENTTIYDFSLQDVHKQQTINLSQFDQSVVLIAPQYLALNALQHKYGHHGFKIIGVPSNIFRFQEPGMNGTEILHGIKSVRPGDGFVPNFPLTEKVDVNGQYEHPLYTYLKFLIGKDGRPIKRYSTYVLPMEIEADIRTTL
ncbi:hypothetical protein KUTeg_004906, partial [Tegillarca granosa]